MSSSSTTETKTFTLEKYSRAYSNKKESNGGSEWQHFTNPVLRLILDMKMSPEKAESFRLRVVWTMHSSGTAPQDIVLEDLDLLSFSSLSDVFKSESSPLKGVYRETTFGLRYLYVPESSASQKVYRRFQVSFSSSVVTQQLVDAISSVCPCKTTEPSTLERKKTAAVRVQPPPPPPPDPILAEPHSHSRFQPSAVRFLEPNSSIVLSGPPRLSPLAEAPSLWPAESEKTAVPLDSSPPPAPTPSPILPESAVPPPSSLPTADPDSHAQKIADSLREATGLYEMPYSQLAKLVGDVVREDGFTRLMENLSSMWVAKALATSPV
ncbi:hypothetical protein MIND_01086100 [Mycena indigotica]|uniref:Uncharacterized protein n=1 Tax=Mycena indigotica TaxID=2126181 RepID=A0A8H6SAQ7_9AGAR|nr:uncharacterized protein MIND_01086100 [Mycena indigotica]KAF7295463.1 hypothetical protein MIND_01086100 [Mycena indigotica]